MNAPGATDPRVAVLLIVLLALAGLMLVGMLTWWLVDRWRARRVKPRGLILRIPDLTPEEFAEFRRAWSEKYGSRLEEGRSTSHVFLDNRSGQFLPDKPLEKIFDDPEDP